MMIRVVNAAYKTGETYTQEKYDANSFLNTLTVNNSECTMHGG